MTNEISDRVRAGSIPVPDEQPYLPRLSGAGSLRRELEAVLDMGATETSHEEYRGLIVEANAAQKGSISTRTWVWRRLKLRYLLDPELAEFRAFLSGMRSTRDVSDRGLLAFLMMARTDRLFRNLTLQAVAPRLSDPDTVIEKDEVHQEVVSVANATSSKWSDSSVESITSHLLSSLKDFGVLRGSVVKKTVKVRPGKDVALFATRLGQLEGLSDRRTLDSRWFRLLGLSFPETLDLMYAAAQDGSLQFRFQADVAEIRLPPIEVAS